MCVETFVHNANAHGVCNVSNLNNRHRMVDFVDRPAREGTVQVERPRSEGKRDPYLRWYGLELVPPWHNEFERPCKIV